MMLNRNSHAYDDIISLPHHISSHHPQMPIHDRAAQFAPFAALSGHEAAIWETARRTEERMELDEDAKAVLDEKMAMLQILLPRQPQITVTYFKPDEKKSGGSYITVTENIKKIDEYEDTIMLVDGLKSFVKEICNIEGDIFTGKLPKRHNIR